MADRGCFDYATTSPAAPGMHANSCALVSSVCGQPGQAGVDALLLSAISICAYPPDHNIAAMDRTPDNKHKWSGANPLFKQHCSSKPEDMLYSSREPATGHQVYNRMALQHLFCAPTAEEDHSIGCRKETLKMCFPCRYAYEF